MTREQLQERLLKSVATYPSMAAWADAHGIKKQTVSAACRGDIPIEGRLIAALGVRRVVVETFVEIGEEIAIPEGYSQIRVDENGRIRRVNT